MSRIERIVVQLPLTVDVVGRLMKAVDREFPGAKAVTDHDYGQQTLVMEVTVDDRD